MQNEIDLSQLFDEVEPLTVLNLGKGEKYPVYASENLPVADGLRLTEVNARLAELGVEAQAELDALTEQAIGLKEDEPKMVAIQQRVLAINARVAPIIREMVEVSAQMPEGRLKRLSLVNVMKMYSQIQFVFKQKQEVEKEEEGKLPPLEMTTTTSS